MLLDAYKPHHPILKVALSLGLVVLAFWIRMMILPVNGRVIYSTFYPAIALTALLCGHRYGLFSLLISSFMAYWFLLLPVQMLKPLDMEQFTGLFTFVGAGLIICLSFSRFSSRAESLVLKPATVTGKVIFLGFMVTFALLLRMSLLPAESRVIYSTFYPTIALITLACGFVYGITAMLCSGALVYYFLLPPFHAFKVLDFEQIIGLATFVLASGIICLSLREVLLRGQKIKQVNEALQDLMASHSVGKSLQDLVQVIASTVDMRDPYTAGHQRHVSELGVAIGKKMGLPEGSLMGIRLAGLIHDLGKMGIPLEILTKPGRLNDLEVALIREHPKVAYNALKGLTAPWPLADIVVQHHERIDGTGYPHGLSGESILLEARILAVADVVEAMSAMRPYREGLGIQAALGEIRKNAGSKYDPQVVDACVALFDSGEFAWSTSP